MPGLRPTPAPSGARPDQLGRRERLRQRATSAGLAALPDYELLELVLLRTFPRGEVKPLAKALLARFGSLAAIGAASLAKLKTLAGIGEAAALDLKLLREITLHIAKAPVLKRTFIGSWSALLGYVRVALVHETREQFRALFRRP